MKESGHHSVQLCLEDGDPREMSLPNTLNLDGEGRYHLLVNVLNLPGPEKSNEDRRMIHSSL